MLAKRTSRNQITLPTAIVRQLPEVDYFEVTFREGAIVLTPAVVTASDARLKVLRTKIRWLGLTEKDIERAIASARRRRR